jgi:hypothetical protein
MSLGEALKQFCYEVPVLGLIGTQIMIDKDVQLVCKYLRALDIGGTKGIDKLYTREGEMISIVTPWIINCGLVYHYLQIVMCGL